MRELGAALVAPDQLDGDLGSLYAAYRAELDRLALWDRDLLRAHAVERLEGDLEAWQGQPVFAYGFEDLTAAEWRLMEALAGRAEVTVSLPYEPGRPAFAALGARPTLCPGSQAAGSRSCRRLGEAAHPAIAHVERALFADARPPRRRSRAPSASSRAPARAARSSSSARRSSSSSAAAPRPS